MPFNDVLKAWQAHRLSSDADRQIQAGIFLSRS
jgi:hypothetical protein